MKKNILLLLRNSLLWTCLYTVVFAASSTTLAYFSDSATSTNNLITATFPEAEVVPVTKIVINEVFINGGDTKEWVELYNSGNTSIDLVSWKLVDSSSTEAISTVSAILAPNSYAVIMSNSFPNVASNGALLLRTSGSIGNNLTPTDQLQIIDPANVIMDQFSFGASPTPGAGAFLPYLPQSPVGDRSIIRQPNGTDTDNTSDFSISNNPTFGTANQL